MIRHRASFAAVLAALALIGIPAQALAAGDVRAAIIGSLLILAIMAPLTVVRYQRRNA